MIKYTINNIKAINIIRNTCATFTTITTNATYTTFATFTTNPTKRSAMINMWHSRITAYKIPPLNFKVPFEIK